ncbi:hypothetical protein GO988_12285 [Hymenobacter sp. HMF4947]|uniref:Lipoprotein n=1 Tax=Hymenobacter ginkgonis TaxID=2682976 RepID=A0A7K1TFE5_9BACT|nr:hypothetical protein [Hymenobacter ginkgonis]MVN77105.1 hypothetical protein [Hymenobacter ginkgonis]
MKNTLRTLLLMPALLLAGCCANNSCDCQDLLADALFFKLDQSTFRPSDIDTVYLVQYSSTNSTTPVNTARLLPGVLSDSILARQLRQVKLPSTTIVLSNTYPFATASAGSKLSLYTYRLLVPKGDSVRVRANGGLAPRPVYSFAIGPVTLSGRYNADGCCTCYQNTKKTVSVNGTFYDATESSGEPLPILLRR